MIPLEMNDEIRARWVARLRSGDIEQVAHGLGRGDGRCCLGVLCDLAVEDSIIEPPWTAEEDGESWLEYDGDREFLPLSVVEWAGLNSPNPQLPAPDCSLLSFLNDVPTGFAEIADLIEGKDPQP